MSDAERNKEIARAAHGEAGYRGGLASGGNSSNAQEVVVVRPSNRSAVEMLKHPDEYGGIQYVLWYLANLTKGK